MSTQFSSSTIRKLNALLSLCRGYVDEAVVKAFENINLKTLLQDSSSASDLASALKIEEGVFTRFLFAAATLGLVKEERGKWSAASPATKRFVWKELHQVIGGNSGGDLRGKFDSSQLSILKENGLLEPSSELPRFSDDLGPFLTPESTHFIGPLIESYSDTSKNFADQLVERLFRNTDHKGLPFSGAGWSLDRLESFMLAMHFSTSAELPLLFEQADIFRCRSVLDVGGGPGTVASAVLDSKVQGRAVVYDRETSSEMMKSLAARCLGERSKQLEFVGGDFHSEVSHCGLKNLGPRDRFDLITLGWILHDWKDEDCRAILSRVKRHLAEGGRIVLLECLLPNDRLGATTMLDMTMLVQTEGKERTIAEYEELARSAELKLHSVVESAARRQLMIFEAE